MPADCMHFSSLTRFWVKRVGGPDFHRLEPLADSPITNYLQNILDCINVLSFSYLADLDMVILCNGEMR